MTVFYMGLSPFVILIILIASWAQYEPMKRGDYVYLPWSNAVGWIIAMTAILSVPVTAVYVVTKAYRAQPQDGLDGVIAAFKQQAKHTPQWRANAIKANRTE